MSITKTKIFNGLLILFATLFITCTSLYIWSMHIEQPYLYFQNLPFPTVNKVYAGEPINLAVEQCNRKAEAQTYTTTSSIRNELTKQAEVLPDLIITIEAGCYREINSLNVIPATTEPGVYSARGTATVEGAFVTHRVDWYSEPFEILASTKAAVKGVPGPQGVPGKVGAKGDVGDKGKTGEIGAKGEKGSTGNTGKDFWGNKN